MTKIYLARHGQDVDNANGILNGRRDQVLMKVGRDQARMLALELKNLGITFDAIYTSPLVRATETAEIVSEALEMPAPTIMPELIERDFGEMTGRPINSIEEVCFPFILKTDTVTYFLQAVGAESFPDLLIRAEKVLAKVQHDHPDGSVLLVGHGDMGKMMYASYYGMDWMECLKTFHFGNSELLVLSADAEPDTRHVIKLEQFNS